MRAALGGLLSLLLLLSPLTAKEMDTSRGQILLAGLVLTPTAGPGMGGVQGAQVEIVGSEWKTTTDANGQFIFTKAPQGEVTVRISKEGYKTVLRTAKVDSKSLQPPNFTVELLPEGMSSQGDTLTGKGVLYVAFHERKDDQSDKKDDPTMRDLDIRRELIINPDIYFDRTAPGTPTGEDPSKRVANPISLAPNQFMIYPPGSPGRTTYHQLQSQPYFLAFDGIGRYLYLADNSNAISIYDEDSEHELVGRVLLPAGARVTRLSTSTDGNLILASIMSSVPGILLIDTLTGQTVAQIPIEGFGNAIPTYVCSGPQNKLLVTVGSADSPGQLLVMDPYTAEIEHRIPVGNLPSSVAVTPDRRWAYVSNSRSGNLSVIDLQTMKAVGLLAVGVSPQHCAVTPDGKKLLVANQGSDTVSVVDVPDQRLIGFVRVGRAPTMLAVSPDSKTCYVTNKLSGTISTIDLDTLKQTFQSDPLPRSNPLDIVLRP